MTRAQLIRLIGRGIREILNAADQFVRWFWSKVFLAAIKNVTTRPAKKWIEKHPGLALFGIAVIIMSFLSPATQASVLQSGFVQIPIWITATVVGFRFLVGKSPKFFGGKKKK